MQTVMLVTTTEPTPPTRFQPRTPRDLETICLKCLEKDSAKRYATAEALAEDLRRYLVGEPILARPISTAARLWRWCRRNPKVAALSALVLLLLVLVSIGSVVSNLRIRREQAQTKRQSELAEKNADLHRRAAEEARLAEKKAEDNAAAAKAAEQRAEENAVSARNAEKRAAENAKIAGEQRTLALNTLYSLVTKVDDRLDRVGMSQLRKDILDTAIEGLGKVSKTVENAKMVDRSMGVAFQRMGDLHERLGKTEEAERLHKLSLKIFTKLQLEEPDNDWLPWNQAVSFDKLASFSNEFHGDSAAALDYLQKSLKLRQKLVAAPRPVNPPFPVKPEIALIVSYIKLGALVRHLGDPAQSRDYLNEAMKLCEAVLAAAPGHAIALAFRANCLQILGLDYAHLGSPGQARAALNQSLEWLLAAAAKSKSSARAKLELGAAYDALGDVELEQKNLRLALDYYGKSLALYQGVYRQEPANAYRLGIAKKLAGDSSAAVKDLAESLKLRDRLVKQDPKNLQFLGEHMLSQARLGLHGEASKACDDLRRRAPHNPSVLLTAASGYALCFGSLSSVKGFPTSEELALRRHYAELALETLKQAASAGFRDVVRLETDSELAPLQTLPEFKQLANELRKKQ
jgi:serine/threonine-protein kinase